MEIRKTSREDALKNDPFRDFHVWWDDLAYEHLEKLVSIIDSAEREEDVQKILTEIPLLLVQHLGGGHGRWVLPKQKLGA